jgi:hypothetical protein
MKIGARSPAHDKLMTIRDSIGKTLLAVDREPINNSVWEQASRQS